MGFLSYQSGSLLEGIVPWTLLLAIPLFATWWWMDYRWRIADGEPPLVPYRIPWLGHGLSFMKDINGFTEWVRSIHPSSPASTVQIAGQHLYLIFDSKLASQIYRRSQTFIFDPFFLQTSGILGASKSDMEILEMGAQVVTKKTNANDDGRRLIHDLHKMTPQYLSGDSLDKLTTMFMDILNDDIDKKFPADQESSFEWQTLDLCEYVKQVWSHASITALFGTHIYEIWPDIDTWLWDFDKHFQSLFTQMPRFVLPKAYALLDRGQELSEKWEADAMQAEKDGEIIGDPDWDPYWGLRFVRLRNELLRRDGIETKLRAGNHVVFLWGLNANAIPIAMQVIIQAALSPSLFKSMLAEVSSCIMDPALGNLDIRKVTTLPRFKSAYLEALRWATASPSPRVVREDIQLGPYLLRKGNMAIVHSRTLQTDEEAWLVEGKPESHPSKFWAERFLDDGDDDHTEALRVEENAEAETNYSADVIKHPIPDTSRLPKNKAVEPVSGPKSKTIQKRMLALRPFGGGTTLCPGRHFATNEIMGGLAALMLKLEIEVDEGELAKRGAPMPDLSKQGGLFPDRGLIVRMRRRVR